VPAPSAILNTLNELLKGCGAETQKLELFGILRDIARGMASGDVSEAEAASYIRKLAQSVAVLRQRAGLASSVDEIEKKLMDAVLADGAEASIGAVKAGLLAKRRRPRVEVRERELF